MSVDFCACHRYGRSCPRHTHTIQKMVNEIDTRDLELTDTSTEEAGVLPSET